MRIPVFDLARKWKPAQATIELEQGAKEVAALTSETFSGRRSFRLAIV
jgi:hypothetical protein